VLGEREGEEPRKVLVNGIKAEEKERERSRQKDFCGPEEEEKRKK
jgi:hypothetical protein